MALKQGFDLKQTQSLVMTPQLQQAIQLLQMSNLELAAYLEEEISQNPLLDKAEPQPEPPEPEPASGAVEAEGYDSVYDPVEWGTGARPGSEGEGGSSAALWEQTLSSTKTLREHLIEQLHWQFEDARDRILGAQMIDHLDENGYFRIGTEEMAEKLGCATARVEKLLTAMKRFDPTGIFAEGLGECLALQLEEQNRLDPAIQTLLGHLDMIADGDWGKLARLCGLSQEEIGEMIGEIRSLNPKPASLFEQMTVQTAVPDVLMRRLPADRGGGWAVELNSYTLPKLLVNREYYAEVCKQNLRENDKQFLDQYMSAANWLVRALDQRAQSVLKVAAAIIEAQDAFFLYGIEFLKPLTLKDIAEPTELHESTVSRVTTNKFIATPRGVFELKYFFSSALSGARGGAEHSSEAVKARIRTMIEQEEPGAVLSDDRIAALLQKDGVDIARRTVAKYREALMIPSSAQRRRQKKNAAKRG